MCIRDSPSKSSIEASLIKDMTQLVNTENPEEEELRRRKEELAALEDQLADLELEAAALFAETETFLNTVTSAVALKILERDLLRAKLAEARLTHDPDNEEFVAQADRAWEEAQRAQQEYDAFSGSPGESRSFDEFDSARRSRTSDEVKTLYRTLVKLVHPDLTTDFEEKERRGRFMQEVNAAYEAGDQGRLEELAKRWHVSPEFVGGQGTGADLMRTIRQIRLVTDRIETVRAEIAKTMDSEDYLMLLEATAKGLEIYISDLNATLDAEIAQFNEELMAFSTNV